MRYLPALLLLTLTPTLGQAQPYAFQPQRWYPLQVGNAWYHEARDVEGFNLFTTRYVALLDRDTLASGRRWFHVAYPYVAFNGPYSQAPGVRWLAWSEDAYLLALPRRQAPSGRLDFSNPDTLDKTWPRSAFTVNVPHDTTLTSYGGRWRAVTQVQGPPSWATGTDSTTFRLDVSIHPWYHNVYRYGVGPSRTGSALTLGSFMGGLAYGDVSQIRRALSAETEHARQIPLRVQVHPTMRTVTVHATQGGQIRLFDLLGREQMCVPASNPSTAIDVRGLPAGLYVVHTEEGVATVVLR